MGDLISLADIIVEGLTPASQQKLLEWRRMDALRKVYIATLKAEVARDE